MEESGVLNAKKWLTIITLIISLISLLIALLIGKNSNCIYYDVSMALLGSAVLGFIMSLTEYYVERQKAMEEFWIQATQVLKELRKIKHIDLDAPLNLIIEALGEERSNELNQMFAMLPENKIIHHEAKTKLISWYEENIPLPRLFDEYTDIDNKIEEFYKAQMDSYKQSFMHCMESYQIASTVALGSLNNAYGNLDFIFANKCIRDAANNSIYDKLKKIVSQYKEESKDFYLLKNRKGNFPVCAIKVSNLDKEYFLSKEETVHGYTNTLVYQNIFDNIDASLEKFRCRIYRTKYEAPKAEPISGKIIYFDKNKVGES